MLCVVCSVLCVRYVLSLVVVVWCLVFGVLALLLVVCSCCFLLVYFLLFEMCCLGSSQPFVVA